MSVFQSIHELYELSWIVHSHVYVHNGGAVKGLKQTLLCDYGCLLEDAERDLNAAVQTESLLLI